MPDVTLSSTTAWFTSAFAEAAGRLSLPSPCRRSGGAAAYVRAVRARLPPAVLPGRRPDHQGSRACRPDTTGQSPPEGASSWLTQKPATLIEKIWRRHVVVDRPDGYTLLYIDRHLIYDGSYFAFERLKKRGLKLRRLDLSFGTLDHYMPTDTRRKDDVKNPNSHRMVTGLAINGRDTGVTVFDVGDRRNGIVHVVGPEQGITLPGVTLRLRRQPHLDPRRARLPSPSASAQSSAARHGNADGLRQKKPKTMRVNRQRHAPATGVNGKDVMGRHHRQDRRRRRHRLCGSSTPAPPFGQLSIEGRLTFCNMSYRGRWAAPIRRHRRQDSVFLKRPPLCAQGRRLGCRASSTGAQLALRRRRKLRAIRN